MCPALAIQARDPLHYVESRVQQRAEPDRSKDRTSMTSPRKSPTAVVLVVAFMLAALLSPSAAGAQDHSCSGWSSGGQDIGDFHGTVWRNTDARKGPSTHSSCDRGWDYSKGTRVKVTAQSGGFYWATNTATGDWAWLAKDSVDPDGQVTLTARLHRRLRPLRRQHPPRVRPRVATVRTVGSLIARR